MKKLTPEELAEAITDFVNSFNPKSDEFIQALFREHRTLQQSTIRLFLEVIEAAAKEEYRTDGRNEASHQIAKDIVEGFRLAKEKNENLKFDGMLPSKFLPYI